MSWVIFDAVGTLIVPRESVAATYHRVGVTHGSHLTSDELRTRFHTAFEDSETLSFVSPGAPVPGWQTSESAERIRWQWVVRQVFTELSNATCQQTFEELWSHFAQPAAWRALPDVAATLNALREAGYRLGMASNFDGRLKRIAEGLGELQSLCSVFVSSDIGWRKPAAEFYRHVIEACGGDPRDIWWIGDRRDHDFDGPRAAGMNAWLLDDTAAPNDPLWLRSLTELPERIGRANQ